MIRALGGGDKTGLFGGRPCFGFLFLLTAYSLGGMLAKVSLTEALVLFRDSMLRAGLEPFTCFALHECEQYLFGLLRGITAPHPAQRLGFNA